jgi:3-hydroxyacyl-CoA dehydrogenase/enoyl-CoA hydratase/3-hydroxybutyryl-CoA epimerase
MSETKTAVEERQVFLEKLSSGVAFIEFDAPGRSNHLTSHVVEEFEQLLEQLYKDDSIQAVCLYSRKTDNFLLGADLREILQLENKEDALNLTQSGHRIFNRLASLKKLTIAGINGACLGGGLELALCCDKRVATDSPQTILGLPEVNLGFVPGLGGTQRLPRLIGVKQGLELILSAEPISVEKAKELGLVDEIVPESGFKEKLAEIAIATLKNGALKKKDEEQLPPLEKRDASLLAAAKRAVRIKTRGFYPAQLQVIDVIETGLVNGLEAGLDKEAETFANLAVSENSRNLVGLFFASELAKHTASGTAAKDPDAAAKTIGVIGGGTMGIGLTSLLASRGYNVLFRPQRTDVAGRDKEKILEAIRRAAERKGSSENSNESSKVEWVENDAQFAPADIIIEAVEENVGTKVSAFASAQKHTRKDCVFASITSSLSVASMRAELPEDTQLIGLHVFHPVDKMPLIEVASHTSVSRSSFARISGLIARLEKIPVNVKDTPCFLVNRLLCCYLMEAARLAEAKIPLPWIDSAALAFGMPMGPLTVLDEVGIDLAMIVAESLHATHGERAALPDSLIATARLGLKGKRSESGIIVWDETGKKVGFHPLLASELGLVIDNPPASNEELEKVASRLILPMIDEAARCLEEKVVRRAREIDIATVFGIGFPAFRGGILRYADSYGLANVESELTKIYAETPKPRRTVSGTIKKHAAAGTKFYPQSASAD